MLPHHPTVIVYRLASGEVRALSVHSPRHDRTVSALHSLHAACLRDIRRLTGNGGASEKQEPPEVAASEGSTAHSVCDTEARAASAQSDTTG